MLANYHRRRRRELRREIREQQPDSWWGRHQPLVLVAATVIVVTSFTARTAFSVRERYDLENEPDTGANVTEDFRYWDSLGHEKSSGDLADLVSQLRLELEALRRTVEAAVVLTKYGDLLAFSLPYAATIARENAFLADGNVLPFYLETITSQYAYMAVMAQRMPQMLTEESLKLVADQTGVEVDASGKAREPQKEEPSDISKKQKEAKNFRAMLASSPEGLPVWRDRLRRVDLIVRSFPTSIRFIQKTWLLAEAVLFASIALGASMRWKRLLWLPYRLPFVIAAYLCLEAFRGVIDFDFGDLWNLLRKTWYIFGLDIYSVQCQRTYTFSSLTFGPCVPDNVKHCLSVHLWQAQEGLLSYAGIFLLWRSWDVERPTVLEVTKTCLTNVAKFFSSWLVTFQGALGHLANDISTRFAREQENCDDKHQQWFVACKTGDVVALKGLLLGVDKIRDANVRSRAHNGDTGLLLVCRNNRDEAVRLLLESGSPVDPNLADLRGQLPLTVAAEKGHRQVAATLLACSRLTLDDASARQAMQKTVEGDHYDVGLMILKALKEKQSLKSDLASAMGHLETCISIQKDLKSKKLPRPHRKNREEKLRQYKVLVLQEVSSRAAMASSTDSKLDAALMNLISFAECDICFDSMTGKKIFACSNDHWTCEECVSRMCCHTCKEDFAAVGPPRRCYNIEKSVEAIEDVKRNFSLT